ncbi:hypothetical protein [Sphingomonas sp. J315]|nr:hypothetical protein [Sphingomonas sp. J315]UUX99929.1 hypothetical protein LRS08_01890 [Sphingomonas sp. J315]
MFGVMAGAAALPWASMSDNEGLLGGSLVELFVIWVVSTALVAAFLACLLILPVFMVRVFGQLASARVPQPLAEFGLATICGLVVAELGSLVFASGSLAHDLWYFLLLAPAATALIARGLDRMKRDNPCES